MTEHTPPDDLAAYAIGALPPSEFRVVHAHLRAGCVPCRSELKAFGKAVALLPYSVVAATPPPDRLRERVLALARRPDPVAKWLTYALAASLLLAASLGALWLSARASVDQARSAMAALEDQLTQARQDTARLNVRLAALETESAWLRDPRVQVALLSGLAEAKNAKARLVWHPGQKRGLLYVDGLPPLALTKSYQLWAFVEATPMPAGVFETSAEGRAVFALSPVSGLTAPPKKFAVSIEPKGGVPAPTGAVVLLGETF